MVGLAVEVRVALLEGVALGVWDAVFVLVLVGVAVFTKVFVGVAVEEEVAVLVKERVEV